MAIEPVAYPRLAELLACTSYDREATPEEIEAAGDDDARRRIAPRPIRRSIQEGTGGT